MVRIARLLVASVGAVALLGMPEAAHAAPASVALERQLVPPGAIGGDEVGWAVAMDGSTIAIGADGDGRIVPGGGAVLVYERGAGAASLQAILTADDAAPGDNLGIAASIEGDVILAGAYHRAAPTAGPGKAYVFRRSGTTWSQEATLTAPDGQNNDAFGWSVALKGNVAIVGAPHAWSGSPMGASGVYIFERIDGVWTFRQKLSRANEHAFGWSLAMESNTIIVGAPIGNAASNGRAFAYQRQLDGTWAFHQQLAPSDLTPGAEFGNSLALSGSRLAVGAWLNAAGGAAGSVYFYQQMGENWVLLSRVDSPGGARSELFGEAVAIDGTRALVGDSGFDTAAKEDVGAVHVYEDRGSGWRPAGTLMASDPDIDYFGSAVALQGGLIAVGAPYYWQPVEEELTGAAYLLELGAGSSLVIKNTVPDNESRNTIQAKLKGLHVDVPLPGSPGDPTCAGGVGSSLTISSSASGAAFGQNLPCANWQQTLSGYRYRDRQMINGPCSDVDFQPDGITKIRCSGRGPAVLDFDLEPNLAQAPIGVRLTVGAQSFCTTFGGALKSDGTDGRAFAATNAGAPAPCAGP